ncbi:UDP-glucuronosyltransferase 2B10-like [Liolophura sinensis]|uniref:UDP-glucuronosyltransferase 2B10-like n=1 Tax=Liolophura sinensis TaxID=3198878 RepID=UPI003158E61D
MIPTPQYSVCQALVSITDDLILKGHDVTVYQLQGFHTLCPGGNKTKVITYKPTGLDLKKAMTHSRNFIRTVMSTKPWEKSFWGMIDLIQHQEIICRFALGDEDAFQKIKEGNFDFVLIDGAVYNACYAVIPYALKIPFGIYGDVLLHWPGRQSFRPHTEPDVISPVSDEMSPFDMAMNGLIMFVKYVYTMYEVPIHHVKRIAPELSRKQTVDLLFAAQIYLENDDAILGYAHPRPPNSILIGGIMTKPAKSLPADIEQFLDKATEGAILIAFGGSTFSHFPEEYNKLFTQALSEVNMPVIWKHDVDRTDGLTMKKTWLPVNDILAHPNTRLFIYHCGKNGVYEALYHEVPVLCLPLIYDCVQAAARVTRRGVGKTVELHSLTSDNLRDAINDILSNETYASNTKKFSQIFHSLQQNPRQKAAYWVDHVIKHGAHHLQPSDNLRWAFAEFVEVSILVMFALVSPFLMFFFCLFALKSKFFKSTKRNVKLD